MKNTRILLLLGLTGGVLSFAFAPLIAGNDERSGVTVRKPRLLHEYEVRREDGTRLSSLSVVEWPDLERPHRTPLLLVIHDYDPNHPPDEEAVLRTRHPVAISIPGSLFGGEEWGEERVIATVHWCRETTMMWLVAGTTTAIKSVLEIEQFKATFDEATKKWEIARRPTEVFDVHINQTRRELDRITSIQIACAEKDNDEDVFITLTLRRADGDAKAIKVPITRRRTSFL